MVASSGKQKEQSPHRDTLMDSLRARIEKKADSVAIDASEKIDSLFSRPRIIEGRFDIIAPVPLGPGKPWRKGYIIIWLYKITGNDTAYYDKSIKPLL